jgi:hypothetical protein
MKEADYAVTRGDKIHGVLSLLVMLTILGVEILDGTLVVWYRFAAAPVFATAMIWFSDLFGSPLPWRTAPRDLKVVGWMGLLLIAAFSLLM